MNLEQEIQDIHARNKRVDSDKAWETSMVRRTLITALTYVFAVLWLISIGNTNPLFNAVIPAVGYFFSTLTLSFVKSWWQKS